jgi:hypothetical protein
MSVNPTLQIEEFAEQPDQIPMHVDYHEYTADTSNRSSSSWRIDSPGMGALLDSEAWIEYTLSLRSGLGGNAPFEQMFIKDNQTSVDRGVRLCLRQGYTMQRAMQSISLNINGTTLVERPDRYSDQVLRFYSMPQEVETIMTGSGGYLDDGFGFPYNQADDGLNNTQGAGVPAASAVIGFGQQAAAGETMVNAGPDTYGSFLINEGYSKRCTKFWKACRDAGAADSTPVAGAGVQYPNIVNLKVWERVPVSPFMVYESRDMKRSIPHINQMTLTCNWNSSTHTNGQQLSMIFQGFEPPGGSVYEGLNVSWFADAAIAGSVDPVLHLKWYMPPMGYRLPPQISIPIIDYQHFAKGEAKFSHDNTLAASAIQANKTYNNIRLEQMPDYLFIYVTPEQSNTNITEPSEHLLEITALDISADGDSGKMLNATSMDLYSMYVKNAMGREMFRPDYEKWRKHHCLVVLKPEDLGLRYSPGIRNPITLNLRLSYRSHWLSANIEPAGYDARVQGTAPLFELWGSTADPINKAPNINVLCEYRKYRLTLTEGGGSRRELLSLPKPDISSIPQAVPEEVANRGLQGVF